MKALIAIVMFLFGLFVGILVMPFIKETVTPLYIEEEYSMPRIKTILNGFGVTLPPEVTGICLFNKQNGEQRQLWVKFECSPEVKDAIVEQLNGRHSGMFNREIDAPKMFDGTAITWWSYRNSFRYYEFNNMCAAYDDILRTFYLYAVSDGNGKEEVQVPREKPLD